MPKRVLVVDDSAMIRMQVKRALLAAGFEVSEAVDGLDALEKMDAEIALAVLDVNMPRMNGLELLQALKDRGTHDGLPIVMLTTESQPELIRQARALGAQGWLVKPFRPDLLVAAVEKMAR